MPTYKGPGPSSIDNVAGGVRQLNRNTLENHYLLWCGRITSVDIETMVCTIQFDNGDERNDVPIIGAGGAGPRSYAGVIPEVGSRVIVDWAKIDSRTAKPIIVGYLTVGVYSAREYEPFLGASPEETNAVLERYPELRFDPRYNFTPLRLKLRKAYPGDFLASSSGGSDIILDKNVTLQNRAGNEFKLRDSDQTAVLQTRNEYTSNAAGYYKRGIIRRSAFTFLPDLYPLDELTKIDDPYKTNATYQKELYEQKIPKESPAYDLLRGFGLIDEEGSRIIPFSEAYKYPFITASDGQRINYITEDPASGFDIDDLAYIEDRKELRHKSTGIAAVTEEGDGFQIDKEKPIFIEDVHGTVVGNDFTTDAGKNLYKQILQFKVFPDVETRKVVPQPFLSKVDTTNPKHFDSISLARLYRVLSPDNKNEYIFGINKEGRVNVHIPASRNDPDRTENGRSVDLNAAGLVKAAIGSDGRKVSLDMFLQGGMLLQAGRGPNGLSLDADFRGPLRLSVANGGQPDPETGQVYAGVELDITGGYVEAVSGNRSLYADDLVIVSKARSYTRAESISHNAGLGGLKQTVAGDYGMSVGGFSTYSFTLLSNSFYLLGRTVTNLAGIDQTTMLLGAMGRSVVAGTLNDTVVTGSMTTSVLTGNYSAGVGLGNLSISVGIGALSINSGLGPVSVNSSTINTMNAASANIFNAPFTKLGAAAVGFSVAGIPGPPGPHLDYMTGLPILGVPTVSIG